jgi:hypothetical protein
MSKSPASDRRDAAPIVMRLSVGAMANTFFTMPCCEFAEHDQKARNCEHGFPTSRHDLLAPLVLIEPERVDTSRDESLRAHDANVFRWPCVEVA